MELGRPARQPALAPRCGSSRRWTNRARGGHHAFESIPSAHLIAFVGISLGLAALAAPGTCGAEQIDIEIQISPSTLNLANEGVVVTIHTDIPYARVVGSTVVLFYLDQGVAITSWRADNRGYFVAKFLTDDLRTLEELVVPGYNLFELCGLMSNGDTFIGSDEVWVMSRKLGGSPHAPPGGRARRSLSGPRPWPGDPVGGSG